MQTEDFRSKPRQRTTRLLDICIDSKPIAYISFNPRRSEEQGQFIWRTTKHFKTYTIDAKVLKRYSHYIVELKKCISHCLEWLVSNTNANSESFEIKEPKQTKVKTPTPIVVKKMKESEDLIEKTLSNLPKAS